MVPRESKIYHMLDVSEPAEYQLCSFFIQILFIIKADQKLQYHS